jgi:hypothetical protein
MKIADVMGQLHMQVLARPYPDPEVSGVAATVGGSRYTPQPFLAFFEEPER